VTRGAIAKVIFLWHKGIKSNYQLDEPNEFNLRKINWDCPDVTSLFRAS